MRTGIWGAVVGGVLGLVVAAVAAPAGPAVPVAGEVRLDRAAGEQLVAFSASGGDGKQLVTIIDPRSRVMSVYCVDGSSGMISLKSVRNIHHDLQMDEFNGASPSPREIRALLQQR